MANESTEGDVADVGGLVGVLVVTGEGEEGSVAMEMKMSRSCERPKQANENASKVRQGVDHKSELHAANERKAFDGCSTMTDNGVVGDALAATNGNCWGCEGQSWNQRLV